MLFLARLHCYFLTFLAACPAKAHMRQAKEYIYLPNSIATIDLSLRRTLVLLIPSATFRTQPLISLQMKVKIIRQRIYIETLLLNPYCKTTQKHYW